MGNCQKRSLKSRSRSVGGRSIKRDASSVFVGESEVSLPTEGFSDITLSSFAVQNKRSSKSQETMKLYRLETAFIHAKSLEEEMQMTASPKLQMRSGSKKSSNASINTDISEASAGTSVCKEFGRHRSS
mmetsp:Transcript_19588/g.35956  ORF Transcript_19588/g.35956 Transcript_19588/m.35956 type:complete len:129 (+) Transcript_19588:2175-2561(+)